MVMLIYYTVIYSVTRFSTGIEGESREPRAGARACSSTRVAGLVFLPFWR